MATVPRPSPLIYIPATSLGCLGLSAPSALQPNRYLLCVLTWVSDRLGNRAAAACQCRTACWECSADSDPVQPDFGCRSTLLIRFVDRLCDMAWLERQTHADCAARPVPPGPVWATARPAGQATLTDIDPSIKGCRARGRNLYGEIYKSLNPFVRVMKMAAALLPVPCLPCRGRTGILSCFKADARKC